MSHDDQIAPLPQPEHAEGAEPDLAGRPAGGVADDVQRHADEAAANLAAVPVPPPPPESSYTAVPIPMDDEEAVTDPTPPPAAFQPRGDLA